MRKLTVVIPTYNEAKNLPALAAELWALPIPGLKILVVDDASPDGTGKIAEEMRARQPERISVIHREGKLGLGSAYIKGFQTALQANAEERGRCVRVALHRRGTA
jgi:dolichol-phosphate mannosyltransferase